MITALVKTPVSQGYLSRLEKTLGDSPQFVNLNLLQARGLLRGLFELWCLKPRRLILPAEDVSTLNTLPILQLVAACTRAQRLEVALPDGVLKTFSRVSVIPTFVSFLAASALNALAAFSSALRLRSLLRRPRIETANVPVHSVLYINANLWFGVKAGGSIGHVAGVINALLRRGVRVDSAACGRALLLDDTVTHVPLVPQRTFGYPVELNNYRFDHKAVGQLRSRIERSRPSFIYQRLSLGNFTGVSLSRKYGIPLVTEYNGSEAWVAKHWGRPLAYHGLAVKAEDAMLRHSHLIVTISEPLRGELMERGIPRERIVMYPNCIDPGTFDPRRFTQDDLVRLRERYGLDRRAIVATFVGTFGQWHGVDVLARSIRKLLDQQPEYLARLGVRFLLVGDGTKMGEVRAVLDHPLASRYVVLAGLVPQHEAPLHLAASDILLSPHVRNPDGTAFFGSPTKLFEYMAMGKPIIASDLDQIGEVLANSLRADDLPENEPSQEERRLAVLAEPGSEAQLLLSLNFLAERPGWRERLGANVRREALSRFTWDRHVDAILEGAKRVGCLDSNPRGAG